MAKMQDEFPNAASRRLDAGEWRLQRQLKFQDFGHVLDIVPVQVVEKSIPTAPNTFRQLLQGISQAYEFRTLFGLDFAKHIQNPGCLSA